MDTAEETSTLKLDYKLKFVDWYFHTVELYQSYDTHAVVSQIKSLISYKEEKNILKEGDI